MRFETSTIGHIASVQTGPFGSQLHKEDYVLFGTPIVTVEHLGQRKMTRQNLPCVSETDKSRLARYTLQYGDLVFSRVGSVDRCSWVSEEEDGWMFSGRCLRVRPNEPSKIYHKYLYYFFCLESIKDFVRNIAVGATMPSINTRLLSELPITFPSIEEQRQIGDTLSALDDKIENNTKINHHLEQMAQAIFKSWFVDFEPWGGVMPGDWREVEFSTFLTPRVERTISDENTPMLSVTNDGIMLRNNKFNKILSSLTTKVKLTYYSDLIFGNSRHTLNWGIVRIPAGCVSSVYNVFSVADDVNTNYLESFMKANIGYFSNIIRSTTRDNQSIDICTLMQKSIYLPPRSILANYYAIEGPLTEAARVNTEESSNLTALRDTLLPRLMSGELSVAGIGDAL